MTKHVNKAELEAGIEEDLTQDVDALFAPSSELDSMMAALKDPKRFTRSGQQVTLNKFAKALELVAAELVQRDAALRLAYAKLKDQQACDEFMGSLTTTVQTIKGGTFEISRPTNVDVPPSPKRGWFKR